MLALDFFEVIVTQFLTNQVAYLLFGEGEAIFLHDVHVIDGVNISLHFWTCTIVRLD